MAMTVAPIALPTSTAARPTPPPAPCTSRVSPLAQLRAVRKGHVRGAVSHREPRCRLPGHRIGDRDGHRRRRGHRLRVAAGGAQRDHPLSRNRTGHALAHRGDVPGDLQARGEGQGRLLLILPLHDQGVGEVHAACPHPDEHLADPRRRGRHVLHRQRLGRTPCPANHRSHDSGSLKLVRVREGHVSDERRVYTAGVPPVAVAAPTGVGRSLTRRRDDRHIPDRKTRRTLP